MGDQDRAERLEIAWPSGRTDVFEDLDAGQILLIEEGQGITDRLEFSRLAPPGRD